MDCSETADPSATLLHEARGAAELQRARGAADVSFRLVAGRSRIATLRQEGCLKLRFPRLPQPAIEAVSINTSGGLTGGDRLSQRFAVGEGASATVTTQACERVYRASAGRAEVETRLVAGEGARLSYLPQETILFEGGALQRRLEIDVYEGAEMLVAEPIILGREAMGETLAQAELADRWAVRCGGRLVFADALRLGPDMAQCTRARSGLGGARALGTVLLVSPRAESFLPLAREIVGKEGGASLVEGCLVVRMVSSGGFALRKRLVPLLQSLAMAPLPRVWSL